MRNLGENEVKETDVGALASATIGGTMCQAPVSGPAPVSATVEAEVEVSFEGSDPEAQAIDSAAADHSFWGGEDLRLGGHPA